MATRILHGPAVVRFDYRSRNRGKLNGTTTAL
ncbi:uncharacterized protein G2W53_003097 [Senna tora]|uniref:Uncharacterized protein n=1 Tax=Senna tora TaxID=362788 RepID=A0A834XB25_9FABA|nr:uncharacterized protein G2W53_003097 [Senna tora]